MQTGGQEQAAAAIKAQRALATRRRAPRARPAAEAAAEEAPQVTLALGLEVPPAGAEVIARPEEIDAALLARVQPERVLCPMIGPDYDALSVATLLRSLDFAGVLVVVAPDLPNPRMVEREIRNQAGGLRVSVVTRG
ncbi:hypothetical protein [Paragemmobacter ruber]|uniref:Uncharacterized protein n=1 Tax=Paragemmobacter ruber TaxID=1985673 RepID=A0ABW9Y7G3_9RHOB|nr:hypothetical protein [Rhodobacter ruber]NBE08358.1 hypothetical protein [Rhodobacter ruber]